MHEHYKLVKVHSSGRERVVYEDRTLEGIGEFAAEKTNGSDRTVGVDNRGWFDAF